MLASMQNQQQYHQPYHQSPTYQQATYQQPVYGNNNGNNTGWGRPPAADTFIGNSESRFASTGYGTKITYNDRQEYNNRQDQNDTYNRFENHNNANSVNETKLDNVCTVTTDKMKVIVGVNKTIEELTVSHVQNVKHVTSINEAIADITYTSNKNTIVVYDVDKYLHDY
jgi:hypothetical protein